MKLQVHVTMDVPPDLAEYYRKHLEEEWERRKPFPGFWNKVVNLSFGESHGNISTPSILRGKQADLF